MTQGQNPDPLLFAAALIGMVCLGALFAAYLLRQVRKQGDRLAAQWQALAPRLGGQFRRGPGGLASTPCSITFPAPQGELVLDILYASTGNSTVPFTRTAIDVRTSHELRLSPEDVLTRTAAKLGGGDVSLGDPQFDAAFVIKTDDVNWLTRQLDASIRRALLTARAATFAVENGRLTVTQRGLLTDPAQLTPLVDATRELAQALRD